MHVHVYVSGSSCRSYGSRSLRAKGLSELVQVTKIPDAIFLLFAFVCRLLWYLANFETGAI